MYESDETTTVGIKPCVSCGAGLVDASKFCRSCGAAQSDSLPQGHGTNIAVGGPEGVSPQRYSTTRLSQQRLYHPVSGPLVNALVAGVPASTRHSPVSSYSRKMLLALMAIPIWVMIILLSPLDAYASAKIIGSRI